MRILVVEDDLHMASLVARVLRESGYAVDVVGDGVGAVERLLDKEYDLVVLDILLPGLDGFAVCRRLRADGAAVPVLMLSARSEIADRIRGLEIGADDYLPKPFEHAELLARVKALLRRAQISSGSAKLKVRDLTIDPSTRRVERRGKEITLTQKEYLLLEYLVRNAGRTVTREMIGEHVWKHQLDPLTNVVDVYINYLRRKLGEDKADPLIRTVRGSGYAIHE